MEFGSAGDGRDFCQIGRGDAAARHDDDAADGLFDKPFQRESPLKRIGAVSGGELSRIMLAVKSAFASSDPVDTILFDEIDAGIGGEVAVQLGHYLSKLSAKKQVLCITHLATIAVNADNHILVTKRTEGERTCTEAAVITGQERTSEIARMLSGKRDAISLEHAQSLLAKKIKS